jgi:hypothetical protein
MRHCIFPATHPSFDRRIEFVTDQALTNSLAGTPDNAPPGLSLTGPPPAGAGRLERPARVLLGWLPPERGEYILVSNRAGVELTDQQRGRVR